MNPSELLAEAFARIAPLAEHAVSGLAPEQLSWQPSPEANSIGWLVWHLARVQDDHVAEAADQQQVWQSGWADRFALPYSAGATGYGQSSDQVRQFRVADGQLLVDYLRAVQDATLTFVNTLSSADLDRVVDDNWDPPVTLGIRLTSVVGDDLQHAGQANYLRGLLPANSDEPAEN
ncbi:DinB family protein [Jatrophihabitans telluris]|uniref:DinB family protein n=1 Tax=Jatrophihabitans telluris TaxID=2038343 RepID=A0ABY4QUA5_9ACTN|nr:DUF664 domain-containing protein [Jatrophihabitans telluris]UQX86837.1 DinB family protein [Jatrophihabitans telluris]